MKKIFAVVLMMLVSPLAFSHPGHVHDGVYSGLVHLMLAVVFALAIAGAGILAIRAFQSGGTDVDRDRRRRR